MKRQLTCLFSYATLCISFTINSHTANSQSPAEAGIPVSDRVVLAAGQVQITEYEVRKNHLRFQQDYRSRHRRLPGQDAVKEWIKEFTGRTYILADAFDKGYFEKEEVNKSVESMARLIIGQTGGLLEQKLLDEQLSIGDVELQKAVDKSRRQLFVEYLKFPDYDQALDFMGGLQAANLQAFRKAVEKSRDHKSIIHREDTLQWPFMQLGIQQDYITSLEKGALTPVLALPDGYYVMYVQDVRMTAMPDQQRRNSIMRMLTRQQKEKARQEYMRAVQKEAAIEIRQDILQALDKKLTEYGPLTRFEKDKYHELLALQAITYTRDGETINVTTAAFMDFYNNLPLKKELGSAEALTAYMHAYVMDDHAYRKAEKLGITRDPRFLLDRDNYKKTVICNLYETNELKAGIEIPGQEISDRYEIRKQDFKQATSAIVSMFLFDTRNNAMTGRFTIMPSHHQSDGPQSDGLRLTGNNSPMSDGPRVTAASADAVDTSRLTGMLHIDKHRVVQYNEPSLPDTVRKVIFSMPVQEMSRPVPFNNQYLVIIKESETGQRIQSLAEVKDILQREIAQEKFEKAKQERVALLKEKYVLKGSVEEVVKGELSN